MVRCQNGHRLGPSPRCVTGISPTFLTQSGVTSPWKQKSCPNPWAPPPLFVARINKQSTKKVSSTICGIFFWGGPEISCYNFVWLRLADLYGWTIYLGISKNSPSDSNIPQWHLPDQWHVICPMFEPIVVWFGRLGVKLQISFETLDNWSRNRNMIFKGVFYVYT